MPYNPRLVTRQNRLIITSQAALCPRSQLMTGEENLRVVAEIAVAFSGFASIIAVFQRSRSGQWAPQDILRMWNLIVYGLAAVMFSLIPLAFTGTGITEATIWSVCSFLLATFLVGQAVFSGTRIRSYAVQDPARYSRRWAYTFLVLTLTAVLILFFNGIGAGFNRSFSGYFIGLLWLLVGAGLTFTRLLGIAFRESHGPSA